MLESTPLAAWLLRQGPPPSPDVLRNAHLGAYGYATISRSNPERALLRPDYIASLARHQQTKREIVPLVRAWRDAGIEVLLFRGFHLAEFVYPLPGARSHAAVDILIRRDRELMASRVARSLGWHQATMPTVGAAHSHIAFSLVRPSGASSIDAHRSVLPVRLPWNPVQRRLTDAAWDASRGRWWEGNDIRELSPADMLLLGVVLQRCWSDDRWEVKPQDVVDYEHIVSRCGVGDATLRARARELGCERTLDIFLSRCDPHSARVELGAPRAVRRWRWNAAALSERGLLGGGESAIARIYGAPSAARAALEMIPTVLRVRLALRHYRELGVLLAAITPRVAPAPPSMGRADVVASMRWAIRLAGTGRHDPGVVLALSLYVKLREVGWAVDFVSGVRRDRDGMAAHAWVEHDGVVLPELRDAERCATFAETFRFPSRPPMGLDSMSAARRVDAPSVSPSRR